MLAPACLLHVGLGAICTHMPTSQVEFEALILHNKTFYGGWHVKMGLNFFCFLCMMMKLQGLLSNQMTGFCIKNCDMWQTIGEQSQ